MTRVVLISGASRGLGRRLAELFAQKGYCVYSGVRDIDTAPPNTFALHLDLENDRTLQEAIKQIIQEQGKIDILINNAGLAYWCPLDSMTVEELRRLFEVNVFGTFRLTQLVLPHMRSKCSGRILFVSSIRAVETCAYMGAYSGTKAAIEAFALDLAIILKQWNIFVSVVQPGPLDTGIELKHGSYFQSCQNNPYLPYKTGTVNWLSVEEASNTILSQLEVSEPVFKFQTHESVTERVRRHLKDPSGTIWYHEQLAEMTSAK